ncbi:MAG TPA: hypothetical protein VLL52_07670 [Anaerolineae bacterium]|nr:hypothetical protein [Anaerolineae bacterium]
MKKFTLSTSKFTLSYPTSATLALLSTLFVILCYSPTIPLPYFWDDAAHIIMLADANHLDIWTNAVGYRYYRPLSFSFYKLTFDLLPYGATTLPHIIILALHGLNSFLAGKLCRLIWHKHSITQQTLQIIEFTAILIFALLPFAALPIIHFAGALHPLTTFFTLAAIVSVLKYLQTNHSSWYFLAIITVLISPYWHESGIMAGSLIILTWFIYNRKFTLNGILPITIFPILSASFLAVWLAIPKPFTNEISIGTWDVILAKITFFSQSITYPLQPIATYLIQNWGWWDLGVILTISLGVLILAASALIEQKLWWPFLFSLGWLAITMLPIVVALPFDYIITSPRLLYFPGISAVILWSTVLAACFTNQTYQPLHRTMGLIWLLLLLAFPFAYIQREVRLHIIGLTPLQQLSESVRQYPDERHLIVNTVDWIAYQQPVYPLGHDGVTVSADYILPSQLVFANTGINMNGDFVSFSNLHPDLPQYHLATLGQPLDWDLANQVAQYDKVWFTHYTQSEANTQLVGHVDTTTNIKPIPDQYLANFDHKAYLLHAAYEPQPDSLKLTLDWWFPSPDIRPDAVIFANVFDCAGNFIGPESGHPLGKMLLVPNLPTGAKVHDIRHVPLDTIPADNCYQVEIGFFFPDGTRMTAYAPDGSQYNNQLFLLSNHSPPITP